MIARIYSGMPDLEWKSMLILSFAVSTLFLVGCDTAGPVGVTVIQFSGPAISEEAAGVWTANVEETGRVVLETHNAEGAVEARLALLPSPTGLPIFMGFTVRPGTDQESDLRSGYVAIESFAIPGVVSGEVRGRVFRNGVFRGDSGGLFWVELREPVANQ